MNRATYTILVCVFLLTLSGVAKSQDDLIKVESRLVVLNALVTDGSSRAVADLSRDEFRVFEDGEEQRVEFFEAQETPFAAVILLDSSGSMESRVSLAMSAAINFLDGLRFDDVVAIYNFDSKVSMVQDFSNSRDVHHRIFDLEAKGWTVLNDGIVHAAELLANRIEKRRAIVVLSDGEDSRSRYSESRALKAASDADATIYTVDMSGMDMSHSRRVQSQRALKRFARRTGGEFIKTPGGAELRDAFRRIVAELGTQYTLGYHSRKKGKEGWRDIELRVRRPNLSVRTRRGYFARKDEN